MKNLLLKWLFLALAVLAASKVTEFMGLGFKVESDTPEQFGRLMIGVAILSLLNATLGNVLKFLTIPLNCLTLGLVSLVINALMLWLAAGTGFGMSIQGEVGSQFLAAFVASLIISAVSGLLGNFLKDKKDGKAPE